MTKLFGLIKTEDAGAAADSNGAHGVDGDNPNDLVDMGKDSSTPFNDENDGNGYDLVLTKKIEDLYDGFGAAHNTFTNPTGPKVGFLDGTAEYNVLAGGNSDVTIGSSYVDIDGDGDYNSDKDIVLEGVESYVVTGNSTVTQGAQPVGSASQLLLRSMAQSKVQLLMAPICISIWLAMVNLLLVRTLLSKVPLAMTFLVQTLLLQL